MPSRYFFHAPDGRIYGPAPLDALRRWRDAGRLRADSRLRAEGGDDLFLTLAEVEARESALPPVPEPPPSANALPPIPDAPPLPPPAQPFPALLSEAWLLAGRAWRRLSPLPLLMQLPWLAFCACQHSFFHITADPKTRMASWDHTGALFVVMLGFGAWSFLGTAFLALPLRDLRNGVSSTARDAWREFAPRIGGLLWTFFLAVSILAAWGGLTLLLAGSLLTMHGFLFAIILVTALLSAVPTVLLALRCQILPQAAVLEKRRGLGALRRAIEVVRFSSPNRLFSAGDLRLLLVSLAYLPGLFLLDLILATFIVMAMLPPGERLFPAALGIACLFGAAALKLIHGALCLVFFEDTRRRLRDAGIDPS